MLKCLIIVTELVGLMTCSDSSVFLFMSALLLLCWYVECLFIYWLLAGKQIATSEYWRFTPLYFVNHQTSEKTNQARPTESLHATQDTLHHYYRQQHSASQPITVYSLAWGGTQQQPHSLVIDEWCLAVVRGTRLISLLWKIQWKIRPLASITQHKSNKMAVISRSQRYNLPQTESALKEKESLASNMASKAE